MTTKSVSKDDHPEGRPFEPIEIDGKTELLNPLSPLSKGTLKFKDSLVSFQHLKSNKSENEQHSVLPLKVREIHGLVLWGLSRNWRRKITKLEVGWSLSMGVSNRI